MGDGVGDGVGDVVGDVVGDFVGESVGESVGDGVGDGVGEGVGEVVGESVGAGVGEGVGDGVGQTVTSNTLVTPLPSSGEVTATIDPSADSETCSPSSELPPAPMRSLASCTQSNANASHWNTRERPTVLLLFGAPTARRLPSSDKDTDVPKSSNAASPTMSEPR